MSMVTRSNDRQTRSSASKTKLNSRLSMASSSKEVSQSRPTRKRPLRSARTVEPPGIANKPSRNAPPARAIATSSTSTSQGTLIRRSTRNIQSTSVNTDAVVSQSSSSRPTSFGGPSGLRSAKKRPAEDEDDRSGATRASKRRRTEGGAEIVETQAVARNKRAQEPSEREVALHEAALETREAAIETRETEIKQREIALKKRETAAQKKRDAKGKEVIRASTSENKVRDLEARISTLTKERNDYMLLWEEKEYEREKIISSTAVNLQWILAHLEDSYQCSLCFETLAVSYAVNNGQCGHSFCASCILKWAFAALHRECGYWHEPLECPLCRAPLPYTSEKTPRALCTVPFIPNRVADSTIEYFLDLLKTAATRPEGSYVSAADGELWYGQIDEKIIEWGAGKSARVEWDRRAKIGGKVMKQLVSRWDTLGADDFINFKDRLATA